MWSDLQEMTDPHLPDGLDTLHELDREPGVAQYVRADEGKLRQVLMNLLGNAVKFTDEGQIKLRVARADEGRRTNDQIATIETEAPSIVRHSSLVFEVEDTGPGIAPEELAAVFEPFVQTTTGQQFQEGTGLGLPISRQFVRLMGGDLTVRSELGQGSTFRFNVPVQVVDATVVQTAQPTRRVIGLESEQPIYRLLVVDDAELNRKLLVKLLVPLGFEVREAVNGREAIEIWERWEPHLIWMDMRMPDMDGYEATRRIKATTKGQATVIVAVTASALEEDKAVILSEGCDAYIRKPFREAEVFDVLGEHLRVRFVYEEAESEAAGRRPGVPGEPPQDTQGLTASYARRGDDDITLVEELAALPADWVGNLELATILGDLDRILTLTDRIREWDTALAGKLADLAGDFEHDRILALIQQARERKDE